MTEGRVGILEKVHGLPVLDVGTGDGWLAIRAARDYGLRLTSIDCDEMKLHKALRNAEAEGVAGNIEFIWMDAADISFPDDFFGTVMAYQTLHHSVFPFRVVDEMFRVCRKGGCVIISELNRRGFDFYAGIYYRYPGEKNKPLPSAEPVDIHQLREYLQGKASKVNVEEHEFTSLTYCEK